MPSLPRSPKLESELIGRLRSRGMLLSVSESATGGLIARRITSVAGCSDVFWGAVIAYANSAKEEILGVPKKLLRAHGAVSKEVAGAMAEGGLRLARRAQPEALKYACLSTTGIAGPGGGSDRKPVGLCYIGLAVSGKKTRVIKIVAKAGSTREQCQALFTRRALELAYTEMSRR